jgi:hypothetical protein
MPIASLSLHSAKSDDFTQNDGDAAAMARESARRGGAKPPNVIEAVGSTSRDRSATTEHGSEHRVLRRAD